MISFNLLLPPADNEIVELRPEGRAGMHQPRWRLKKRWYVVLVVLTAGQVAFWTGWFDRESPGPVVETVWTAPEAQNAATRAVDGDGTESRPVDGSPVVPVRLPTSPLGLEGFDPEPLARPPVVAVLEIPTAHVVPATPPSDRFPIPAPGFRPLDPAKARSPHRQEPSSSGPMPVRPWGDPWRTAAPLDRTRSQAGAANAPSAMATDRRSPAVPVGTDRTLNDPVPADWPDTEHQLRDGDSLPALSDRYYGTSRLGRWIFEANRDRLDDPDVLPLNVTLTIPAPPAGALSGSRPPTGGQTTRAASPPSDPASGVDRAAAQTPATRPVSRPVRLAPADTPSDRSDRALITLP